MGEGGGWIYDGVGDPVSSRLLIHAPLRTLDQRHNATTNQLLLIIPALTDDTGR